MLNLKLYFLLATFHRVIADFFHDSQIFHKDKDSVPPPPPPKEMHQNWMKNNKVQILEFDPLSQTI